MKRKKSICSTIALCSLLWGIASCESGGGQSANIASTAVLEDNSRIEQELLAKQKREEEQQRMLAFKNNIETVLQKDAEVGKSSGDSYDYQVSGMREINISSCPTDFQVAYVDHIHAWERRAKIHDALVKLNSNEKAGEVFLQELVNGALGGNATPVADAIEAHDELKAQAKTASTAIRETFENVEHIAASYGASLPK